MELNISNLLIINTLIMITFAQTKLFEKKNEFGVRENFVSGCVNKYYFGSSNCTMKTCHSPYIVFNNDLIMSLSKRTCGSDCFYMKNPQLYSYNSMSVVKITGYESDSMNFDITPNTLLTCNSLSESIIRIDFPKSVCDFVVYRQSFVV